MAIFKLATNSLLNRKATVGLTIFALTISITLLLGVDRLRTDVKNSFLQTVSGTDLIVGSRTGAVQLLLYSVFRMGDATNNISWESYQDIIKQRSVKWAIPLSLGDSHRGYRVLGTNQEYFTYYQFGQKQNLSLLEGKVFSGLFDVVLGYDVAQKLGYQVDDNIVVAHGTGKVSFKKHDDMPFKVVGILNKTGTPVDQTLHVSLEAIEAIHIGWDRGVATGFVDKTSLQVSQLQPEAITAFMLALKSKVHTFKMQRTINEYQQEPLSAIVPGVALHQLWRMLSLAEKALLVISLFVVISGFIGMIAILLATLNERRREMAILRSVGARPAHIMLLLISESLLITLVSSVLGLLLLYALMFGLQPIITQQFGLYLPLNWPSNNEWMILAGFITIGTLVGLIPAWRAYRRSLADGLTIRL